MLSSATHTFTDPDDFASTIRQATVELVLTRRGHFAATLTRIDLHSLWMQRFTDNLPRIAHTHSPGKRAVISFQTQLGPDLIWNGMTLQPVNVIRHSEGASFHQRSSGPTYFGAMSLPVADMVSAGAAIAELDLMPPRDAQILTPPPAALAKLQRLHASAGQLAQAAPEVIADPGAARGLEQALVEAMVACLSAEDVRGERLAQRHHELIMRRFRRLVEESPDEPLYIPEVCAAIGVPGRTLRVCCQEHLGMSPKRFLLLRRFHLARRALRAAAPGVNTVTEVAAQFGFWHFGRFTGQYTSVFGELPSDTLHRLPS
jgi:AraC-like DNA-binding protein